MRCEYRAGTGGKAKRMEQDTGTHQSSGTESPRSECEGIEGLGEGLQEEMIYAPANRPYHR